jgi:hypothetical protein
LIFYADVLAYIFNLICWESHKFEASLSNIVKPCFKKQNK